ncbi:hypothetical protein WME94_24685 [Sorangium sp. So ce429]
MSRLLLVVIFTSRCSSIALVTSPQAMSATGATAEITAMGSARMGARVISEGMVRIPEIVVESATGGRRDSRLLAQGGQE